MGKILFVFLYKYKFKQSDKESLHYFMNKLREKNQNEQQRKQASNTISIYYKIEATLSRENVTFKNENTIISIKKVDLKPKNANWKQVYDDLNAEIKIRHYSPNTLKNIKGGTGISRTMRRAKIYNCYLQPTLKIFSPF